MSRPVDVLAAMDHNLKDRAERADRYGKKADKAAAGRGSRNPTSDRKADLERHLLEQLSAARAATAKLIDALEAMVEAGEFSDWDNRCTAQDNARAVLALAKGGAE
ncbi:hypothetical protein V8017_16270 [Stenotrophomonas rhizophila]